MKRALVLLALGALAATAASQAGEVKRTVMVGGQRYCAKHRVPRITVRGFEAKPLTLVHRDDPLSPQCDAHAPNRISDSQHLIESSVHTVRGMVTYCPRCEADYTACMAEYRLAKADEAQITGLVLRRSGLRRPIIRIVPVDTDRALVIVGSEQHVGDIFEDFGVTKEHSQWHVSSAIYPRKILAVGQ